MIKYVYATRIIPCCYVYRQPVGRQTCQAIYLFILFFNWSCKASHLLQTSHGFRYSFMCQCPTRSMLQSPYCLSQLYLCSTTNLIVNRHKFLPDIVYDYILQILVLLKHFIKIKTSIISLFCFLCLKEMQVTNLTTNLTNCRPMRSAIMNQ